MYPSLEGKVITGSNCYFLLDLAREYQIAPVTQKCEDFLVSAVKTRMEKDVLAVLIIGQDYELQTLIKSCVYEARRLSLGELKQLPSVARLSQIVMYRLLKELLNDLRNSARRLRLVVHKCCLIQASVYIIMLEGKTTCHVFSPRYGPFVP